MFGSWKPLAAVKFAFLRQRYILMHIHGSPANSCTTCLICIRYRRRGMRHCEQEKGCGCSLTFLPKSYCRLLHTSLFDLLRYSSVTVIFSFPFCVVCSILRSLIFPPCLLALTGLLLPLDICFQCGSALRAPFSSIDLLCEQTSCDLPIL